MTARGDRRRERCDLRDGPVMSNNCLFGLSATLARAGQLPHYGGRLFRWSAHDRRLDVFTLENGPVREPGDRSADQRGKPEQP